MSYLYIDIETIPTQSGPVRDRIAEGITPPGNISKAETIAAWEAEKKPILVKEAIAKTALDGSAGHICCIGWAFDDEPVQSLSDDMFTGDGEEALLDAWIAAIEGYAQGQNNRYPVIVGHNVIGFDIRFIWQRAIVLGVKIPNWFPRDPKPWSGEVFDTMTAFAGYGNRIGLDRLCEALDIEGKGNIDGSMIGDLWAAGEHERIAKYCRDDVERTRKVHRRMRLAFGEAA